MGGQSKSRSSRSSRSCRVKCGNDSCKKKGKCGCHRPRKCKAELCVKTDSCADVCATKPCDSTACYTLCVPVSRSSDCCIVPCGRVRKSGCEDVYKFKVKLRSRVRAYPTIKKDRGYKPQKIVATVRTSDKHRTSFVSCD